MRYYKILKMVENQERLDEGAILDAVKGGLTKFFAGLKNFLVMVFGKNAEADQKKDATTLADDKLSTEDKIVKIYNDRTVMYNNLWPEAIVKQHRINESIFRFDKGMLLLEQEAGDAKSTAQQSGNIISGPEGTYKVDDNAKASDKDENKSDTNKQGAKKANPKPKNAVPKGVVDPGQITYCPVYISLLPITKEKVKKDNFNIIASFKINGYSSAADASGKFIIHDKITNVKPAPGKVDDLVKELFTDFNNTIYKENGVPVFQIQVNTVNPAIDIPQPLTAIFNPKIVKKDTIVHPTIDSKNYTKNPDLYKNIYAVLEESPKLKVGGTGMLVQTTVDGKNYIYEVKRFSHPGEYPLFLYASRMVDNVKDNEMKIHDPNFKEVLKSQIELYMPKLSISGYDDVKITADKDKTNPFKWLIINPKWELKPAAKPSA